MAIVQKSEMICETKDNENPLMGIEVVDGINKWIAKKNKELYNFRALSIMPTPRGRAVIVLYEYDDVLDI